MGGEPLPPARQTHCAHSDALVEIKRGREEEAEKMARSAREISQLLLLCLSDLDIHLILLLILPGLPFFFLDDLDT